MLIPFIIHFRAITLSSPHHSHRSPHLSRQLVLQPTLTPRLLYKGLPPSLSLFSHREECLSELGTLNTRTEHMDSTLELSTWTENMD